jgi:lipoprotein-releasing system permease protein
VLIVVLSVLNGYERELRSRMLAVTSHATITGLDGEIADWRARQETAAHEPGVKAAVPFIESRGLLANGQRVAGAMVRGILPEEERTVTELGRQVEGGELEALHDRVGELSPVLLGRDLASTLAVGPGDVVTVTSPQGRLSPLGLLPRVTRLRVVGLVRTGLYEFDSSWAYLPLDAAQRIFGEGGRATLVEVRVEDLYRVRDVEPKILEVLGSGYVITDWIETNESLFSALWLEKVAIGITIGLIVMVAALNIVATLVLMVMEKHKDVAILVSMGASRTAIMRVFMLQGTLIGAAGTAVGGLLGWLACRVLDHYKMIKVPVDVYQVSYVPFTLLGSDALAVVLGSMLVCFLATLYPARSAARLDPAEALRYE